MLIKYILLVLIAYILVGIIRKFLSRKIHSHEMAFWLIFWALAAVVVIRPDLTQRLADLIGIGRGVDLVIYLAIIFSYYFIFQLLLRQKEQEKLITSLTRELAIDQVSKNDPSAESAKTQPDNH